MAGVKLEIRMAGQVVIRLASPVNEFEAWVIGLHHKPMLSVPLSGLGALDNTFPRLECTYLDAGGEQYAMIDITGYEVWVKGAPGTQGAPTPGYLDNLIKLSRFLPNNPQPQPKKTGGVASIMRAWAGTLQEAAVSRIPAQDQQDINVFNHKVASQAVLEFDAADEHVITLAGKLKEHKLTLSVKTRDEAIIPVPSDGPFVVHLTSICGWSGVETSRIDFEDASEIYPDNQESFNRDIRYYPQVQHPRTGSCSPKLI